MFSRFFIERPIFATVLSILLVLGGSVGYFSLPIAQYPEITPPTVEVSAQYPGANCQTVSDTVAAPIEQQVNGVEDMMYMSSRSTNDGTYSLTVTFKPGTDLNIAQVLVQNRVNLATPVLPELVRRRGVTVKKKSPTVLMIINLFSPDTTRDSLYLSNYATIQLRDELARVSGVGDITYLGQRDYSMRLWLDPEKMTSRKLAATDIVHAIEQQNLQVAAGQIGQPPAPINQTFQYTINTLGRLTNPEQFEEIIIKNDDLGRVVRVRDVGRVELGAIGYDQSCSLDGKPSVALSVYQLPGSNAIETANQVRKSLAEFKAQGRFAEGVDYAIVYDTTPFINESIREVERTLIEAVILVAAVMMLFLQSWRAAIIPLAAVPVAIIGTFAAMAMLGYSLNNLTLFGLVLAVGIVVDDAIVVVEAVQHHIEEGMSPVDATIQAMDEVAGPVVAVGLVLAAVFVPCVFISGIVGEFFRQFAVTIAISTLISAFNSLTLSPALCALLLKSKGESIDTPFPRFSLSLLSAGVLSYLSYQHREWLQQQSIDQLKFEVSALSMPFIFFGVSFILSLLVERFVNRGFAWFFRVFNLGFDYLSKLYLGVIRVILKISFVILVAYIGLNYGTFHVLTNASTGFIPEQDKGYLLVNVQLPDSASASRTQLVMKQIDQISRNTSGVEHTVAISGQSVLLGANSPNFGTVYLMLEPFEKRNLSGIRSTHLITELQAKFSETVPGALINVFDAPSLDGLGAAGGFTLVVEDPSDTGALALQQTGESFVSSIEKSDLIRNAFTGFRADTPWLKLEIDRVAAKTMGVSISELLSTLQVYFGSLYVNDFNRFGRTWQVNLQADGKYRKTEEDLKRLRVRSDSGEMVPVAAILKIRSVAGPVMVQRYNLYPATTINIMPMQGVGTTSVIRESEERASVTVPPTMRYEWTELALLQLQTKDTATRAFILAVILAFLVLAAQYESWALPLAVILVVPMCLLSAAVGVVISGGEINIFVQVGFVVLVGLACKNAILIVEFAKMKHESGMNRIDATLAACQLRLRPIIMTSLAFILGVLPLVLAEGAGAEMRVALGTAVFAGMTGVTLFGIILTPVFYFVIQGFLDRWNRRQLSTVVKRSEVLDEASI
jgi:multidrug efflux pump